MTNSATKPYKWKQYVLFLESRDNCSDSCKYFHYCPHTSTAENSPCRLSAATDENKRRFFNLFIRGERGLKDEFFETIYRVGASIDFERDTKAGASYVEMLLKAKRTFYDKEKKNDGPEELKIKVNATAGFREVVPITREEEDIEEDPESLFHSDIVDAIIDADVRD